MANTMTEARAVAVRPKIAVSLSTPLRIVVADDEPDMIDYYQRILPRMGHEVVGVCGNGLQLLKCCRQKSPDLVITDMLMPLVNADKAIRRIWKKKSVPVIIVSAYHFPSWLGDGIDSGLLHYLEKPITQAKLESAIDELLKEN